MNGQKSVSTKLQEIFGISLESTGSQIGTKHSSNFSCLTRAMIFAKQQSEAHYCCFYSFLTLIQFALNRFLNIPDFYWKRMRGDQAESFTWDMRRLAPSVMGPAAQATGMQPAVMGPTLAYSSPAQATGLAAPPSHRPLSDVMGQEPSVFIGCTGHWPRSAPATDHWALSSSVNRGCKDLAEEASCLS